MTDSTAGLNPLMRAYAGDYPRTNPLNAYSGPDRPAPYDDNIIRPITLDETLPALQEGGALLGGSVSGGVGLGVMRGLTRYGLSSLPGLSWMGPAARAYPHPLVRALGYGAGLAGLGGAGAAVATGMNARMHPAPNDPDLWLRQYMHRLLNDGEPEQRLD